MDDGASKDEEHRPPRGTETRATWTDGDRTVDYTATARWIVLRKDEEPSAEVFSVSYVADGDTERPVTFVFNGGPGASSAYLHVGTVGPRRIEFPADGSLPEMPTKLTDNEASWLPFTDLVFIDPVGTGLSRVIPKKDAEGADSGPNKEYYAYNRDLSSMCEFMSRWLSEHNRWGSPVHIAGESYGGYRVARLARKLQEDAGIGLTGAILVSPALEIAPLSPSDYDAASWIDRLPVMAGAAVHHGRSRAFEVGTPLPDVWAESERFATNDYARFLVQGAAMPADERDGIFERLADLIGVDRAVVDRMEGRIPMEVFRREILRDERTVVGLYDATVTAIDPFPDREPFGGPDPTLAGIGAAYSAGINALVRSELGVETDREYVLLSMDVNMAWKLDGEAHAFSLPPGASDDFRYGMALNPHMRAFITHGRFDLVTPYFGSDRLVDMMRLDAGVADRITVEHFHGGHMFYSWESSRAAFTASIERFMTGAG